MEPTNIEDDNDEHINAPKWIDFSTLEDSIDKNDETLFFCIPALRRRYWRRCVENVATQFVAKGGSNRNVGGLSYTGKEGVSVVGVQQIDHVVEVVEETLKGHEVCLLKCKTFPALDLTKLTLLMESGKLHGLETPWAARSTMRFIYRTLLLFDEWWIEHTFREANRAPDHIAKLAPAMGHFDLDVNSFDATLVQICDKDKRERSTSSQQVGGVDEFCSGTQAVKHERMRVQTRYF
ncbi:hypothetical protein GIB67_013934 [Kingdonia uniflora]|uniref:Uncharacterized protein n=1 Tax=Kingdonia uniflora TaxID=39325 RepID=A0A7J7LD86_9MAGN|nr:hypothetical protein GIB67_013934 [Kingdonia uniflora]